MDDDLLETNGIDWNINGGATAGGISSRLSSESSTIPDVVNSNTFTGRKEVRDLFDNRYTKGIRTTAIIDSRDRDTTEYPFANSFEIDIGKQFDILESIELTSVDLSNSTPAVNSSNNQLKWTYPRECDVSGVSLIPTVDFADIPADFYATAQRDYCVEVPIGFYTITQFKKRILDTMNSLVHSMDDSGRLSDLEGELHHFYLDVDTTTHMVEFVDRVRLYAPVMIQTILDTNDDILRDYIVGAPGTPDANAVYITIPDNGDKVWLGDSGVVGDLSQASLYPVVHTNMPTIGGIPEELLNMTKFWDRYISASITSEEPYYEFADTITIGNKTFSRYKFYPKSANGSEISVPFSQNIALSSSFETILNDLVVANADVSASYSSNNNNDRVITEQNEFNNYLIPESGLSLPFSFGLNCVGSDIQCGSCEIRNVSVLKLLGWDVFSSSKTDYRFIQSNAVGSTEMPFNLIRWERNSIGDYILSSEPYVLMKLSTQGLDNVKLGGNIVKTNNKNVIDNNGNIGYFTEPSRDMNQNSIDNIFAKIQLDKGMLNRSNTFTTSKLFFYDQPLRQIERLKVELVDRNGQLVNIRDDWNFTLEFVELRKVLRDTQIDTRSGSFVITGKRPITYYDRD